MAYRYAIALGARPSSTERAASGDLADCILQMVGQRPLLVRGAADLAAVEAEAIFAIGTPDSNPLIARQTQSGADRLALDGLGPQGFAVQSGQLDGKPVLALAGQTGVAAMYATSTYLEKACGVGFFNDGNRVPPMAALPITGLSYRETPHFQQRVWLHHAVWTRPYDRSFRLWAFDDWKRLIDWMRRKKLNALNLFHDEGTYLWGDAIFRAFPEIPKNTQTLQHFTMLPEYRTELNRRIFHYARDHGVSILYNLFYSQVPDFFAQYFPELGYHQLQMGNLGICASQPACAQVMRRYWDEILDLYGLDETHLYGVCGYQHEAPLCEHFDTRTEPTRQAFELLRSLDPKARLFVENWCWYYGRKPGKNPEHALHEWEEFHKTLPMEVGVYDWDRVARPWRPTMRPPGAAFNWYKPREWISLHHLTMEWSAPPDYGWQSLTDTIHSIETGAEHEAMGLGTFHILARTNELPSYVFAEMAWAPKRSQAELVDAYLKLRFRPESLAALTASFAAHFEAVTPDARMLGVNPTNCWPAEWALVQKLRTEGRSASRAYLDEKLADFQVRAAQTEKALALAQSVASQEMGNPFYDSYVWQLNYLKNRWYGLSEFFGAYQTEPTTESERVAAGEHFHHVLAAFYRLRAMYRDDPGIKMSGLSQAHTDVRYNPTFLENWQITIWRESETIRHHNVVWEFFPEYEARLLALGPAQTAGEIKA
jgi:hypothetical protein